MVPRSVAASGVLFMRGDMVVPITVFLPMPLGGSGVTYTCSMITQGMANDEMAVTVVTPRINRRYVPTVDVIEVLPRWARYLPYRWVRSFTSKRIEDVFLYQVARVRSRPSVAYIWPDMAAETIRTLRRDNIIVMREMINCPRCAAKAILDMAYEHLGTVPQHKITTESAQLEKEALEAVDYIFCPSPMVYSSLLGIGIARSKLLEASYGWDPARLKRSNTYFRRSDGLNAVFVGTISVRKGAHLLLKYWAQSGVKGQLTLAGRMEPAIKERCAALLSRDDVVVLDFVEDVGALYRSADVFLFPSLEEGGPMVTYEACGAGLPVITSPMGAGAIVRNGYEGMVIDPYDSVAWTGAIANLASNVELRIMMGRAAADRAQAFIWDSVAARRQQQILAIAVGNR